MQPRSCVGSVEPVPGTVRAEKGFLRQILCLLCITNHRGQAADEPWVVLTDGRVERVVAGGGGWIHVRDSLHITRYNSPQG